MSEPYVTKSLNKIRIWRSIYLSYEHFPHSLVISYSIWVVCGMYAISTYIYIHHHQDYAFPYYISSSFTNYLFTILQNIDAQNTHPNPYIDLIICASFIIFNRLLFSHTMQNFRYTP